MVAKDDSRGWRFTLPIFSVAQVTLLLKQTWRQKKSLLKMVKKVSRWREVICLLHCQDEFLIRGFETIKRWTTLLELGQDAPCYIWWWLHTSMVWLQSNIYLPTICEKIGKDVELFKVSIYQCSILFNNLGSFNRKSEFRKPENLNKPVTKGETMNIAELSLLEFGWNNYAHAILTSEADSSPTEGSCLESMAWWDAIQPEAMICQSMQNWTPQVMFAFGNQSGEAKEFSCAAIFEVKICQKSGRGLADLREQTVDTLFSDFGTVAVVIWRQRPQHHWRQTCAYCKMYSGHQEKGTGDQIKS